MLDGEIPKSIFQQAAELPPDAPHILADHFASEVVVLPTATGGSEAADATVIDIDEYEDDLRDREWQAAQKAAREHVEKLKREERDR